MQSSHLHHQPTQPLRTLTFKHKALAFAIGAVTMAMAANAFAQAVKGTIQGTVPVTAGETIQITGGSGINRNMPVGSSGRYSITLPVGTYTVTLKKDGKPIQSREGVTPTAAGAVTVNFVTATVPASGNATQLAAVKVIASAIPPIDVSTTTERTTITSRELQALPLQRTAAHIALLAPGVVSGAPTLGTGPLGNPLLSFGGASVAENAYYIDGMNTTDQLSNQGGIDLPYGAIQEQQTLTNGYGARYGRAIGGVISQISKSGTNKWHFGFKASPD